MSRPDAAIAMLEELVGFDTTSRRSNMALIDFVTAELQAHGVAARLVTNAAGDKANLYASIGPDRDGGVVLSGHTDVVPVDGQRWTGDPFQLCEDSGKLYGRGTTDMKGFIACALALLPEMAQARLNAPIHFALSYDEEIGCRGVPAMIARLVEDIPAPLAVIVGEPTEMKLVNAHKGLAIYRTRIKGRVAHSSQTQAGASAVMAAGRLIAKLHEISEHRRLTADPNSPFAPPYSTMTANTVNGGTAINILAAECQFEWDLRVVPGDDQEAIVAEMRAFARDVVLPDMRGSAPEAEIVIEEISAAPALAPEANGAAEALIRALTGANTAEAVAYGTEAGLFQAAGMSTIVCGPGAVAQAHQPDEWVAIDQLAECTTLLRRLIRHLSG